MSRFDFDKPEKLSGDEVISALAKSAKETKKEVSGTHTMTIKINGVEKAISELDELNGAIEKYEGIVSKNGQAKGIAKYFGTQEKMVSNLRNSWNSFIKDLQSGKINQNNLGSSASAKLFLREANALEAVYGPDAINSVTNNKSVLNDMKNVLTEMKKFKDLSDNGYNFSPDKLRGVLSVLKEIYDIAANNGVEESSIQGIFKTLGLDKTHDVLKNAQDFLEAGELFEKAMNKFVTSNSYSASGSSATSNAEETAE